MDTRETITLDEPAQRRLTILTHLMADELTLEEAAILLGLSVRQVRRLVVRLRRDGAAALVHGNRERRPVNRIGEEHRAKLLDLARETYRGFNPVHMAETIAEEHPDLAVSARSLRRILAGDGITPVRTRRPPQHRSRRERMPRAGMLLQADGSKHDWLEGRGPWLTLIADIVDAIGEFSGAVFREQEDAAGYFEMLAQTACGPGLPLALYTDRHGIFVTEPGRALTLTEQLRGQEPRTQVGRGALDPRGQPTAKGRSERAWGTLQDRLVSELRRADASTLGEANVVLARYVPRFNARFGVPARIEAPAWQASPSPFPLEAELCFHYRRTVARDATIPWDGTALAVPKRRDRRSWSGRVVTVEEHLDGSLWVRDGDERHRLSEAPAVAPLLRARKIRRAGPIEAPSERPVTDEPRPRVRPRGRDHPDDPRPTTPGGATVVPTSGDKVAGRLAVRVAVPRHHGVVDHYPVECLRERPSRSADRRPCLVGPRPDGRDLTSSHEDPTEESRTRGSRRTPPRRRLHFGRFTMSRHDIVLHRRVLGAQQGPWNVDQPDRVHLSV